MVQRAAPDCMAHACYGGVAWRREKSFYSEVDMVKERGEKSFYIEVDMVKERGEKSFYIEVDMVKER